MTRRPRWRFWPYCYRYRAGRFNVAYAFVPIWPVVFVLAAPTAFLEDGKRGLTRYDPLRMRIADDVRDRNRANPLSSLIRLEAATA